MIVNRNVRLVGGAVVASTLLMVLMLTPTVEGFSTGAPLGACDQREPSHSGSRRNPTPNPYILTTDVTQAQAGVEVKVTLSGGNFKGYLVQAVSQQGQVIGTFSRSKTIDCGYAQSTATHKEPHTMNSETLVWNVPDIPGQVHFRGTVVLDYQNYYTNIYSDPVTIV